MRNAFFCAVLAMLAIDVACGTWLTPAETADVAATASKIAKCEAEGRACKADGGSECFGVYDSCMRDSGLR